MYYWTYFLFPFIEEFMSEIENKVAQADEEENKYLPANPWISAVPTLLAVFIYVIDGTIANVALPHMAGSFSATRDESMWILTSYLIASGIIIPSVDFFSKFFGRKNFYIRNGFYETNNFICDGGIEYEILCTNKNLAIT